jgi:hypothetical protein
MMLNIHIWTEIIHAILACVCVCVCVCVKNIENKHKKVSTFRAIIATGLLL